MRLCSTPSPSADYNQNRQDALEKLRMLMDEKYAVKARDVIRRVILELQFMNEEMEESTVSSWIARLRKLISAPMSHVDMRATIASVILEMSASSD